MSHYEDIQVEADKENLGKAMYKYSQDRESQIHMQFAAQ